MVPLYVVAMARQHHAAQLRRRRELERTARILVLAFAIGAVALLVLDALR